MWMLLACGFTISAIANVRDLLRGAGRPMSWLYLLITSVLGVFCYFAAWSVVNAFLRGDGVGVPPQFEPLDLM